MKNLILLLLCSCPLFASAQNYSRVKITAGESQFQRMLRAGIALDHFSQKENSIIAELSKKEIQTLASLGIPYQILIDDMEKFYADRLAKPLPKIDRSSRSSVPWEFTYGSMGGYYTYNEAMQKLDSMTLNYPTLFSNKIPIGTSIEGRTIYAYRLSDNPNTNENETEVLFTAVTHAREPMGLTQLIYFLYHVLENYGTDPEITCLIDEHEIYFIPVVNPDGYVYNETTDPGGGGMWRKNRRDNLDGEFGVDPNRNYGYMWGYDDNGSSPDTWSEVYRGTGPFSEPEIQTVRDFCIAHDFKICLNYHTYGNILIYPWGYIPSFYTPDSALYVNLATYLTEENFYIYGTGDQVLGYITNGDADDWMYGEQIVKNKIMSMTPEVGDWSSGFWPLADSIIPFCEQNISANLYAVRMSKSYLKTSYNAPALVNTFNFNVSFQLNNIGIKKTDTVDVTLSSTNPNVQTINNVPPIAYVDSQGVYSNNIGVQLFNSTPNGTMIDFMLDVSYSCDSKQYNFTVQYNGSVGLFDNSYSKSGIILFPNPVEEKIFVSYPMEKSNSEYRIEIYDLLGKKLKSVPLTPAELSSGISMKNFSGGLYLYCVFKNDEPVKRGKFSK